jgi:hypothetical protein
VQRQERKRAEKKQAAKGKDIFFVDLVNSVPNFFSSIEDKTMKARAKQTLTHMIFNRSVKSIVNTGKIPPALVNMALIHIAHGQSAHVFNVVDKETGHIGHVLKLRIHDPLHPKNPGSVF